MKLIFRVAKKKTKIHSRCYGLGEPDYFIYKGTPYIQVCNGTIGKGCRYANYLISDVEQILKGEV